jgi:Sulfotransferase family
MKSHTEKVRVFLVNWLFSSLYGMSLGEWLGLLRKHRFAVDLPYLPRAALMTLTGSITSLIRRHEDAKYAPKFAGARVERPLFILGHWRSGTTYLQRLFAADERFAYPNTWEALNPHTFLSTERYSGILEFAGPKTRLIDDMSLDASLPLEDEFATRGTLCSPFLRWALRQVSHLPGSPRRRARRVEGGPAALLQEAQLEVWSSARLEVAAAHVPDRVALGDISRRPLCAHLPQPLRRIPLHQTAKPDYGTRHVPPKSARI